MMLRKTGWCTKNRPLCSIVRVDISLTRRNAYSSCYTIYMQRLYAALLFGLMLCMPFGYAKPAAAETNTKNNNVPTVGQVSIIQVPDVSLVRTPELKIKPHAVCVVGALTSLPLVQQTAGVDVLLACDTVTFGLVPEVAMLPVTETPVQGVDFAIVPPVQASVEPTLAPWHSPAQPAVLVVSLGGVGPRETLAVRTQITLTIAHSGSLRSQNAKTLAQLGFMLC